MADMKQVQAIVRTECVPDLVRALKGMEVPRFYLSRVHAVGAGVDPEDFRVSFDDGSVYTEKSKVEFLCSAAKTEALVEIVREWAGTGHRGVVRLFADRSRTHERVEREEVAEEELRGRFARGEIDEEEYERRLKVLRETHQGG